MDSMRRIRKEHIWPRHAIITIVISILKSQQFNFPQLVGVFQFVQNSAQLQMNDTDSSRVARRRAPAISSRVAIPVLVQSLVRQS
jgi:hypothetical protein